MQHCLLHLLDAIFISSNSKLPAFSSKIWAYAYKNFSIFATVLSKGPYNLSLSFFLIQWLLILVISVTDTSSYVCMFICHIVFTTVLSDSFSFLLLVGETMSQSKVCEGH